jgi:hypothetical protein
MWFTDIGGCISRRVDDAVDMWLRHWHGEFQHTIAASYGVNQGRLNEVLKEKLHVGSKQIASSKRSA